MAEEKKEHDQKRAEAEFIIKQLSQMSEKRKFFALGIMVGANIPKEKDEPVA